MDDKDSNENGGWPEELFKKMSEGHDRFMRQFQQDIERQQEPEDTRNDNPFIIFKHFVDSNLSTLSDSFRNLPGNIAELRSKMQEERERMREEERDVCRRWSGIADASPDHVDLQIERLSDDERRAALDDTLLLLRESHRQNANVPAEKIHALYHDPAPIFGQTGLFSTPMLSPGGACEYLPENAMCGYNQVATSNAISWRWPTREYRWLSVEWFKRSPYSPVALERQPGLEQYGEDWRLAFEDLMNASLDKPMTTNPYQQGSRSLGQQSHITAFAPGLDWMLSLQCRGILPPQLPSLHNRLGSTSPVIISKDRVLSAFNRRIAGVSDDINSDVFDLCRAISTPQAPDVSAESELDLYEAWQHSGQDRFNRVVLPIEQAPQQAENAKPANPPLPHSAEVEEKSARLKQEVEALGLLQEDAVSPEQDKKAKRVDVLSSLTTTHTVRHADGSVTKKIILRERFADGREETQEKVHTYHESSAPTHPVTVSSQVKPKKSSGWFWTGQD